jgi:hypothetical protein
MRRSTLLLALTAVAAVTAAFQTTAARPAQSPIDGRWVQTHLVSRQELIQELIAHGMPPKIAATAPYLEKPALDFQAGRFRVFDLASGKTLGAGRYAVSDEGVRVVFTSVQSANSLVKAIVGRVWWLRWSVYHDRLAFSKMPGRDGSGLLVWTLHPLTRVA